MNKKSLHTLEYDKIIDRLVAEADSDPGKEKARKIVPLSDRDRIIELQAQTTAALNRILKDNKPSFSGLRDPRRDIRPLEKGGTLGIGELLNICRLFEIAANAIASDEKLEDYEDILSGRFKSLVDVPDLRAEINRCILSPEEIADSASAELNSIRKTIRGMDGRIRDQLNKEGLML